jgi:hypothetical protein
MSTKLTHFGLTRNLSNNSKFVGNQKKLQLQKLFQIIPSFSINFLGIFLILDFVGAGYFYFGSLFLS